MTPVYLYFDLHLGLPEYILLGIALAGVIYVWLYCYLRLRPIRRARIEARHRPEPAPEAFPSVSVIVYSRDEAENLARMLPALLTQDYPAPYEVIVVNEGENSAVADVVAAMRQILDL